MTDPISDMLTRIKNAYMARHKEVEIPYSKIKENIAEILKQEGFLDKILVKKSNHTNMVLKLKYIKNQPVLTNVRRVSKPSRRVYTRKHAIPRVMSRFSITILSTPQGIMTGDKARKKNIGGELLCEVW